MYGVGQPLSPPLDTPHGVREGTRLPLVTQPIGLDSDQLRARIYAKSEIHTSTRPALKVVRRRRPKREEEVRPSVWVVSVVSL